MRRTGLRLDDKLMFHLPVAMPSGESRNLCDGMTWQSGRGRQQFCLACWAAMASQTEQAMPGPHPTPPPEPEPTVIKAVATRLDQEP